MKTAYKILVTILVVIGIASCEIEKDETYPNGKIVLNKVDYKGCFIDNPAKSTQGVFDVTDDVFDYIDTVYYNVANDTLTLNVIKNYNCCGLLKDSVIVSTGKVHIFLADTCTELCQCYCMCNFEFQYKFTDFLKKNTYFLVYLKGLNESEYVLWKQTKFVDAPD
jgi:hypothetical protein